MNKIIANIYATKLQTIPYFDSVAGLVQTITYEQPVDDGKTVINRIPVSQFVTFGECQHKTGAYYDLVPDSTKRGILYFEDGGCDVTRVKGIGNMQTYVSRLRLVAWLNAKKIVGEPNYALTGVVMSKVIDAMASFSGKNADIILKMHPTVTGIPEQGANIFSRYRYNEAEMQYLMYPFEFFALDIRTEFSVNPDCLDVFINPSEC